MNPQVVSKAKVKIKKSKAADKSVRPNLRQKQKSAHVAGLARRRQTCFAPPRAPATGRQDSTGNREGGRKERAADSGNRLQVFDQTQADAGCRFCWKHSRQNTGRPCVGLNGTVVSLPHSEHVVRVSTLAKPPFCPDGAAPNTDTRLVLQVLQRLGSFLNCLSWKNNCSPAVKIKSEPQSMHFNTLS
jgi:hypothetical protein